jgi:hypothetical protein
MKNLYLEYRSTLTEDKVEQPASREHPEQRDKEDRAADTGTKPENIANLTVENATTHVMMPAQSRPARPG